MMVKRVLMILVVVCGIASLASAAALKTEHAPQHAEPLHLAYDHPTIPEPARWAGATVIGIIGMFAIAAAVGVGVRLNTPDEMPPTHSHDEPPGASHHHGPGGTAQPGPGGHAHH